MRKGFLQRGVYPSGVENPPSTNQSLNAPKKQTKPLRVAIPCNPIRPNKPGHAVPPEWEASFRPQSTVPFNVVVAPFPYEDSPCVMISPPLLRQKLVAKYKFPKSFDKSAPPGRYHLGKSLIPNAGRGMIASVDLVPGDLILIEQPMIVVPQLIPRSGGSQIYAQCQTVHGVKVVGAESDCQYERLCMNISLTEPLYGGLARDMVRVNHSCSPNARYCWCVEDWAWYLWTTVPIKAGEEITINYVHGSPSSERRPRLQDIYGIPNCRCSMCSLPKGTLEVADKICHDINKFKPPIWYI
ncbi:hypothetical protein BDN72DRAFT_537420 [Pluteus cervinus]|uniref:Uncharacterized protein n=1 Tax=Pluteus cervinus TaxID=181527 RepID=A0ACD3A3V0_9AGAR|nr:hypothetical protein BDN72DRAFT_537420 [Pluteus cervinus]